MAKKWMEGKRKRRRGKSCRSQTSHYKWGQLPRPVLRDNLPSLKGRTRNPGPGWAKNSNRGAMIGRLAWAEGRKAGDVGMGLRRAFFLAGVTSDVGELGGRCVWWLVGVATFLGWAAVLRRSGRTVIGGRKKETGGGGLGIKGAALELFLCTSPWQLLSPSPGFFRHSRAQVPGLWPP